MDAPDGQVLPEAAPPAVVKEETTSTEPTEPSEAPESEAKLARVPGVPLSDAGVALGSTIEVLWEVEMTDGTDESVWWSARVEADADAEAEAGSARLVYTAQHGFETETRRVVLQPGSWLWDAGLKERLPYRREGEAGPELPEAAAEEAADDNIYDDDSGPEGDIGVGEAVKARFQGGERFCAGTIAEAHGDGTYDVLYEDNVLEQHVPRDVIERVAIAHRVREALADESQTVCAESSSDFFELFVSTLMNGPAFARLTAEQRAVAAEKVTAMRPHFDAELVKLREERGWGALVSGEDIKTLLPRVMARQAQAAAAR